MKAQAIVMHGHGGPEVLRWEEIDVPEPGPGEALVRHTAIGLNYIDIYIRTGFYPLLVPPGSPGMEGAGVVEAVGTGVAHLKPGQRVAYVSRAPGAYAACRVLPADLLVRLPGDIDDDTAAAMMLKGMTAEYLLHRTAAVQPGQYVLVHAAAGGMGLLLCQWARHLGARVMGTVSTEEKAKLACANGCEHPILYTKESFKDRVCEITGGRGADIVYDSVGRDTFLDSLACLAVRGHLVSYGQASGPVAPFDLALLAPKSATLSRPTLFHYIATRGELEEVAGHLCGAVRQGIVKIPVRQTYPLAEAAQAHRDLEARKTTGCTVFKP